MKIHPLILVLLIIPFLTGCFGQQKIDKPDPFIKKAKMTEILTDLYVTDGLLNLPEVRRNFAYKDSTLNYIDVIEDHGYTITEFENNIEYYFVEEPKNFEEIYDVVLARLSALESENAKNRVATDPSHRNLWTEKLSYRMPDDGTANAVEFSIPTEGPGLYTIKARVNIYEDDQAIELRTNVYFWYDDGTEAGFVDPWESFSYEKSNRSQTVSLEKNLKDPKITHIRGRLLDNTPQQGHWEMHSSVAGINVSFKPDKTEETKSDIAE